MASQKQGQGQGEQPPLLGAQGGEKGPAVRTGGGTIVRMRTIDQCADYLKATDPETALTKTALRRLVTTGAVPSVKVGKKYLIALENIDAYLSGGVCSVGVR